MGGMVGSKRVVAGVLALALALASSACNGDGGGGGESDDGTATDVSIDAVQQATEAQRTARIEGTRAHDGRDGSFEGVYSADPQQAVVRIPVFLPDGGVDERELRVVDGAMYAQRVVASEEVLADPALAVADRIFLRRPAEATWLRRPASALTLAGPAVAGPFVLLDLLASADADLGEGRRDGELTRYEPTAPGLSALQIGGVSLWIDGEQRLRRVRLEGAAGTYDWEVTAYGVEVEVVALPEDDVTGIGTSTGTAVAPAGDWQRVSNGVQAGVTWALERAPATDGGNCWRFSSTPRLVAVDVACTSAPGGPGAPPEFAVDFPFTTGGAGGADVVVAVATVDVADARFAFADGTTAPAVTRAFSNGTGALVWIGPAEPAVVAATLTTADGTVLSCGPGSIASATDAQGLTAEELAEQRTYPWACTS
jgi:hypothetical protein